jgi:predicted Zn finger-like uncharacterized protein
MSNFIRCPSCDSTLQVPEDRLGRSVKCGRCETVFTATATEAREPEPYVRREEPPPRRDSGKGRRRSRYDDYDDDFDDRYYDIRRRDGYNRSEALSRVAGPAIMLMIYGVLTFLAGLLCVVGVAVGASELMNPPKPQIGSHQGTDDTVAMVVVCTLGALTGFVCGVLIFLGGHRMRVLRSWGLALTATILTFVVGGLTCILLMLVGIWPLIVLVDSKVKRAFELEAKQATL